MAGYNGYSMSNNAVSAYENGEKPLSKWRKADILQGILDTYNDTALVEYLKCYTLARLKSVFLECTSWHHTSKKYNKTKFYSINADVACTFESLYEKREKKASFTMPCSKEYYGYAPFPVPFETSQREKMALAGNADTAKEHTKKKNMDAQGLKEIACFLCGSVQTFLQVYLSKKKYGTRVLYNGKAYRRSRKGNIMQETV